MAIRSGPLSAARPSIRTVGPRRSTCQVLRQDAGLNFSETGYFEALGTGTAAGDLLETDAVGRVFADSKDSDQPLYVGSIETNIGHLEGGAGLAGLT